MAPVRKSIRRREMNWSPNTRARKKHKNIHDICDETPRISSNSNSINNEDENDRSKLRRSSRFRKTPEILDSSPISKKSISIYQHIETDRNNEKKTNKSVAVRFDFDEEDEEGWEKTLSSSRNKSDSVDAKVFSAVSRKGGKRKLEDFNEDAKYDVNYVVEETEGVNKVDSKEVEVEKSDSHAVEQDIDLMKIDTPYSVKEVPAHCLETAETKQEEGDKNAESTVNDVVGEKDGKENDKMLPVTEDKLSGYKMKEGRRCGLCGRGTDEKLPKKLAKESADSDNEAYEGSSASEEPNYDTWDGFGNEPGWLGKLLGPLHDRFGISRVWVHLYCAVWSPEVYFAGSGRLKNVRAALYRGKALKCSRCGRPGATIGCRVDRCPKTYHLACSRAEGCIFDHRKFLIACCDHKRLFQPHGIKHAQQIRRRKAKKLRLEIRKHSNDALRKDLEAEEKWFENCGEDEEFLKREGKRLNRDIQRIAPTYIGGSSETGKGYQGWESVAGLQTVIQCMKEVVILPLLYPDFFSNMGLTPPRGVLLHGYPGTGKTLVVRALIGACSQGDKRIAYFARKGADCLGKYVGDAERQLRLLFQEAEKSQPSIIFFDEIDGLAPVRSRNQDQTHSSVVSTLLSLMDGLKSRGSVIVIGATNRPDTIDPALRRPGRFDREIYFPLPTEKDRSAILALHTKSWPNPLSGTLLSRIAKQTVGYAGADLQALCTQAAMNALKRNFPLKEFLSAAEKGSLHGRLPSIPSLHFEEQDWLSALAHAPPPCSRREAGIAANDVVSLPLPKHLLPCFLETLLLLLLSFYSDERIWLPTTIFKAAKSSKSVVFSSLDECKLPRASWKSHLHHLIHQEHTRKELQKILSNHGLVSGDSCLSSDDGNNSSFDSFTLRRNGLNMHNTITTRSSGFRALITGSARSGHQHLASCILSGFMGNVEIQKVTLATISQEGHGDPLQGLTCILSKSISLGRCVIFMPRIELWALGGNLEENGEVSEKAKCISGIWSSFVEQVDSVCTTQSLIILATCELQNHELPPGIKHFFTNSVSHVNPVYLEHTIPRFVVQIGESFDLEWVINSFTAKLSDDLVRNFLLLLHQRNHSCISQYKTNFSNYLEDNAGAEKSSMPNYINQQHVNTDSFKRTVPNKPPMSNTTLAIAAFGYQILRYPQFAELCWVTSKLREGPSTDINGPWKGWPFNSCVMHGSSFSTSKEKGNLSVVRGLVAVGLLSYKGVYASVGEVAFEVRKVLEILAGKIRAKLLTGKDRGQYLRILSQAAYFEDMVNSWAYKFQSSPMYRPTVESKTKVTSLEKKQSDNQLTDSEGVFIKEKPSAEDEEHVPPENTSTEVQESILKDNISTQVQENDISSEVLEPKTNKSSAIPNVENEQRIDLNKGFTAGKSWTVADQASASKNSCLYTCCSRCLNDLCVLVRDVALQCCESNGSCSTIDDINNVLSSFSVNIMTTFRNKIAFGSSDNAAEYEQCACQDIGIGALEDFRLQDCKGHFRKDENDATVQKEWKPVFGKNLAYLIRDGVLVSSSDEGSDGFHCKYDKLCLCSMVDVIRGIRGHLD